MWSLGRTAPRIVRLSMSVRSCPRRSLTCPVRGAPCRSRRPETARCDAGAEIRRFGRRTAAPVWHPCPARSPLWWAHGAHGTTRVEDRPTVPARATLCKHRSPGAFRRHPPAVGAAPLPRTQDVVVRRSRPPFLPCFVPRSGRPRPPRMHSLSSLDRPGRSARTLHRERWAHAWEVPARAPLALCRSRSPHYASSGGHPGMYGRASR